MDSYESTEPQQAYDGKHIDMFKALFAGDCFLLTFCLRKQDSEIILIANAAVAQDPITATMVTTEYATRTCVTGERL